MSAHPPRRTAPARRPPARRHLLLATAAAATTALLSPQPARAADRYWVDTNNPWTTSFWSTSQGGLPGASIPTNGDNAYVLFNDATTRTVTYNVSPPIDTLGFLELDNTGTGTSTLSQSQGGLGMTSLYDGYNGNGAYTLSGGTNTVGSLYLGIATTAKGSYTLSGTGVLNTTSEYLGYQGQATFTQSAGTHVASGSILMGYAYNGGGTNPASAATYTLSGGTLTVGNTNGGTLSVGYQGNGTLNQSGSSALTTYDLFLGRFNNGGGTNTAATGSYSMTGTASLTIRGGLFVGETGSGTFVQNAGTVTFTGTTSSSVSGLILGHSASATGNYTLNGGSLSATGSAGITLGSFGTGTFVQNGGTVTAPSLTAAFFSNGAGPASSGTYTLNAGTLTTTQDSIGVNGAGTFNQTNGAHVTNNLTLGSNVPVSGAPAVTGTLNLGGGTLTVNNYVFAASGGTATINQTGGTFNVNNWLLLGYGSGNPSLNQPGYATYTLSNGTLNPAGLSVGYAGTNTSTFTQSGGTNNAANFITVGDQVGNRGVYNLQNGTVTAYDLNVAWAGNGTYNQSGGATDTNRLRLAHEAGSSATYTLSAGTLTVGDIDPAQTETSTYVGYNGAGSFVQTGGTHTIANGNFSGVYVGYNPASAGSYRLDAGTLNVNQQYAETYVGFQGTGTFTQNGGTHNAFYLTTGYYKPGVGTYTLNNGTLAVQYEFAGYYGDGTLTQNGGTHTTSGLYVGFGMNSPAAGGPATGSFNLAGGSLVTSSLEQIGIDGTGAFNQTGATHTIGQAGSNNGSLALGLNPTGIGAYALSAGTLTVNGTETIGDAGTGTFTQTGGNHTVTGTLTIARQIGSTGAYHLNAGSLTAPVLNNGQFDLGLATYNGSFTNNATLNVTANASTFTGSLTTYAPAQTNVNFPLTVSGGVTNAGSIFLSLGASLTANGPGLNNNGGNVNLSGGTLGGSGPILNGGAIFGYGAISGGGALTNNGTLTQDSGNLTLAKSGGAINNGQFTLSPSRQLVLISALTNNATLDLGGSSGGIGATVSGPAALVNSAAGMIVGPGTIAAPLTNAGTILLPTGTLNLREPLTSSGAIQLTQFTAHLVGGALTNSGTIQGLGVVSNPVTNNGTIEAIGGTLSLTGPLTNNATGILRAATGSKLLATTGLATNAGVVNLAGGTFDNNGLPLVNTGQLSGFGTFATGGLTNNGAVFLTGGNATVNGPVTNTAGNKISVRYNPALFTGPVSNAGTLEVIGTTATFAAGGPLPAPLPGDAPAAAAPLPGGALDGTGATTLQSGASLIADHVRQSALTLTGNSTLTLRPGVTALAPNGTSVVNQLSLDPTSSLDLANNALIVDYAPGASPIADIRTYVVAAFNGGTWHGPGLTSSLIPSTRAGSIGYAESTAVLGAAGGTFAGQSADPSSLVVRLTVAGDATLDGLVNFDDLLVLAKNYNHTSVHWYQGDFNYDGTVNFDDLLILAKNYNAILPSDPVPGAPVDFAQDLAAAFAAVPEPSAALLAIAACGLTLPSRRRRSFRA